MFSEYTHVYVCVCARLPERVGLCCGGVVLWLV